MNIYLLLAAALAYAKGLLMLHNRVTLTACYGVCHPKYSLSQKAFTALFA